MKKYIFLLIFVNILYASSEPKWFYNIKLQENQIIGYGVDSDLSKAKGKAKNEIASTISTKIKSSLKIEKVETQTGIKKKIEQKIELTTNVKLEDLDVIKSKFLDNKWYIAISYDYSPFAVKFKRLLKRELLEDQKQNSYFAKTALGKSLNSIIGAKLNYSLYKKDGFWYLGYENYSLKLSSKDFTSLLSFVNSPLIDVELNKDVFDPNDQMNLTISSKNSGYISLLYVGSDGSVGLIDKNLKIKDKLNYPINNKLVVKNSTKKLKTFMIVAFYSEDKVSLSKFERISTKKIVNDDFVKLLPLFDKYEATTYVSKVTKKRY